MLGLKVSGNSGWQACKDPFPPPLSSVKPPIFDLLLAILIALYLGLVYLFVQVSDASIEGRLMLCSVQLLHSYITANFCFCVFLCRTLKECYHC